MMNHFIESTFHVCNRIDNKSVGDTDPLIVTISYDPFFTLLTDRTTRFFALAGYGSTRNGRLLVVIGYPHWIIPNMP